MSISQNFPATWPSLTLDFANSKTLDPRVTFTRASTGTYVGADGLVKTAVADQARFDHDPATGESLGLLIEESRVNSYRYSSDLSNAYWGQQNLLITANSTTSPDGSNTATLLVPTTTLGGHYIKPNIAVTTNYITISIFIKSAGHRYIMIRGDNQSNFHTFDIINGTITGQSSLNSSIASIKNYGNSWYRCVLSYIPGGVGNDPEVYFANVSDYNTANFSGNGVDGAYFWGAQLEAGSFPTSYVPTSGSQVIRSQDLAIISGTNFSPWYNPSEGTAFISARMKTSNDATGIPAYGFKSTANSNYYYGFSRDNVNPYHYVNTSNVNSYLYGTLSSSGSYKASLGIKQNSINSYINGVQNYNTTTATLFTPDILYLGGGYTATNILNGHISQFKYYPVRVTDSQLQALTK